MACRGYFGNVLIGLACVTLGLWLAQGEGMEKPMIENELVRLHVPSSFRRSVATAISQLFPRAKPIYEIMRINNHG